MGQIRFNLRTPNSQGKTAINLVYQDKKERIVYPTNLYVQPQNWDKKTQRFKGKTAIAYKANQQLDLYAVELQTILFNLKLNSEQFSKEKVKSKLDMRFNIKTNSFNTIFCFCQNINTDVSRIAYHIAKFNEKATFEQINSAFLNRFCNYLFEQDLQISTINSILTQLKKVWQKAIDEDLTINKNVQIIKKIKSKAAEHIALDLSDLRKIYDYQSDNQFENDVKNRFLLACFSGLRISDWNKIQKSNIQKIEGQEILIVQTQKTQTVCAIPTTLFPFFDKIVKSYPGELPIFDQKSINAINKTLKNICKKAGLERLETVTVFKKEKHIIQKPLCELVTPHTARRTFVTILLNKGYSENEIRQMTGHRSFAAFSRYNKQKSIDNALNIAQSIETKKLKAI